MDKQLLQKYFRNQCSVEEIEQVLNWFQTGEGQKYFEEHLNKDMQQYSEEENMLFYPDVPTEKMLNNIKKNRSSVYQLKSRSTWKIRVSVAIIICSILVGLNYSFLQSAETDKVQETEISFRTISTQDDQQRLITLTDGTKIRLNSNSSIKIPEIFPDSARSVSLNGEAWFDVSQDKNRPFSILANRVHIKVLGTEFNVNVDTLSGNVEVAVAEGMVTLNEETDLNGTAAILTQNTFAVFNLANNEILIEHTPVDNYMSWISGRLYFYSEPLWVVSRYLERLYNTPFQFEQESLKTLSLSTDMAKQDLSQVLDIISKTLSIDYYLEKDTIIWTNQTNQ